MKRILCVGDIVLDVAGVISHAIEPGVETRAKISTQGGGAAANVASWLAVNGVESFVIARIGDDAAGKTVISELDDYGVKYNKRVIPGAKTGVVMILIDQQGERTMFPDSGANSGLSVEDLPDLAGFDAVYMSGYPFINPLSRNGALEIMTKVKGLGLPLIFDPSTVGLMREVGIEQTRDWLARTDVIIMNDEEARYLSGKDDLEASLVDLLTLSEVVVIKRGAQGAVAQKRGSEIVSVPAVTSNLVSTVGAGDSFAAGFIERWFDGGTLHDSLKRGTEVAARCVALVGSRPLIRPASNL